MFAALKKYTFQFLYNSKTRGADLKFLYGTQHMGMHSVQKSVINQQNDKSITSTPM